jgi:hypothetical protein
MKSSGWIPRKYAPVESPPRDLLLSKKGPTSICRPGWHVPLLLNDVIHRITRGILQAKSLLVFFMGNVPPYCQFPVVPWFAKKVMVPWVFWWKDRAVSAPLFLYMRPLTFLLY